MRRLLRILFKTVTMLWLALFVAIAVLGSTDQRIYWRLFPGNHTDSSPSWDLELEGGGIHLYSLHSDYIVDHVPLPFWAAAVLTLLGLTAWVAFRMRRDSRSPPDAICATCGYTLRATPERCPECGELPTTK